jgi:hypothetical protein
VYPDEWIAIDERAIRIDANARMSFDFTYDVPFELSSANEYGIVAQIEDGSVIVPFYIETLYEPRLILPDRVRVDSSFEARLQLHNRSEQIVENFNVKLELPYSIKAEKDALEQQLPALKPGEKVSLKWRLYAVSPSEAAGIVVKIKTVNGGNSVVRDGIEIKGPPDKQPEAAILRRKGD